MDERKIFGSTAEKIAGLYLSRKGYDILAYNYRKPWGEIDIIAKEKDVLVFVEVKANSKNTATVFDPEIRADYQKMKKVIKTATLYVGSQPKYRNHEWRIDVISVIVANLGNNARLKHFKNVAEALF